MPVKEVSLSSLNHPVISFVDQLPIRDSAVWRRASITYNVGRRVAQAISTLGIRRVRELLNVTGPAHVIINSLVDQLLQDSGDGPIQMSSAASQITCFPKNERVSTFLSGDARREIVSVPDRHQHAVALHNLLSKGGRCWKLAQRAVCMSDEELSPAEMLSIFTQEETLPISVGTITPASADQIDSFLHRTFGVEKALVRYAVVTPEYEGQFRLNLNSFLVLGPLAVDNLPIEQALPSAEDTPRWGAAAFIPKKWSKKKRARFEMPLRPEVAILPGVPESFDEVDFVRLMDNPGSSVAAIIELVVQHHFKPHKYDSKWIHMTRAALGRSAKYGDVRRKDGLVKVYRKLAIRYRAQLVPVLLKLMQDNKFRLEA
jgi:hypothetical protein